MSMTACALAAILMAFPSAPPIQPTATPPGVVRATGIGKPPSGKSPVVARLMAERAARVTAIRNLARAVKPYQSQTGSVTIRNFREVRTVARPDGSVEITVEWPASR